MMMKKRLSDCLFEGDEWVEFSGGGRPKGLSPSCLVGVVLWDGTVLDGSRAIPAGTVLWEIKRDDKDVRKWRRF
jgi:hypothetical protein